MNSSWLLLRTQRRSLFICGGLCFLASSLLVYADIRPSDLDKGATIAGLSLVFALVLGGVARFHTRLFALPFPVTHRQLARMPTLCVAALWAASLAGVFAGIGVLSIVGGHAYALARWTPFLLALLRTIPLLFLAFAVLDRSARYMGVGGIGIAVWPILLVNMRDQMAGVERALAFYHCGWPLCIVLGIFFILEAPAHIAAMEYPTLVKQGLLSMNARTAGAPVRAPAMKVLADVIMALIYMLVVIWFFASLHIFSGSDSMRIISKVYLVGIATAVVFGVRAAWQSTHANGFSTGKGSTVFLMQCSVVLLPIAWALGAKRGVVATCDQCRQYKFLWARHCPHCGHANRGDIVRVSPLHFWKKGRGTPFWRKQLSSRVLYRVVLPFYLVCFSLVSLSEVHFRSETVTFLPTRSMPETPFSEIREYLASVDDARSWLDGGGDAPLFLPQRFRIEVGESLAGYLYVQCYWLRWEEAGKVGERIRARISDALPNSAFCASDIVGRSDYGRGPVNRVTLPSYLDGRIHWITQ